MAHQALRLVTAVTSLPPASALTTFSAGVLVFGTNVVSFYIVLVSGGTLV